MNLILQDAINNEMQKVQFRITNTDARTLMPMLKEAAIYPDYVGHNTLQILMQQNVTGILSSIVEKFSADELAGLFQESIQNKINSFMIAAGYQKDQAGMLSLINKLTDADLSKLLLSEDDHRWSGLMQIVHYQNDAVVTDILARVSTTLLTQLLHKTNDQQQPLLQAFLTRSHPQVCMQLFEKCQPEILAKAFPVTNNFGSNGMHYAAACLDATAFSFLLDHIPVETLNTLLCKQDQQQFNYLHLCMRNFNCDVVLKLLTMLDREQLCNALCQQQEDNITAHSQALFSQDERVIEFCHQVLDDERLNWLFTKHTKYNDSPLSFFLRNMSDELCLNTLARISDQSLLTAINVLDRLSQCPLHYAALYKRSDFMNNLLMRLDDSSVDKVAALQSTEENYKGWTLFNMIAFFHRSDCMMLLLQKTSAITIARALRTTCENTYALRNNLFHHVFIFQNYDICAMIMHKLPAQDYAPALCRPNAQNFTAIMQGLLSMPPDFFVAILNQIPADQLEKSLMITSNNDSHKGMHALHIAIETQNTVVIIAMLERISPPIFDKLMQAVSSGMASKGYHPLALAADLQPPQTFLYLLSRLSDEALSRVLPLTNMIRCNVYHMVARTQPGEVLLALMQRTPDKLYNELMIAPSSYEGSHGWTPFSTTIRNQVSTVVQAVINKLDDDHLDKAFRIFNEKNLSALHILVAMHDYTTIVCAVKRMFSDTLVYINKNSGYSLQHGILENVNVSNEERQELLNVLLVN